VRVAVVDQLEQAAVQVIKEALLLGDIDAAMELDKGGVSIVEQSQRAIVTDKPARARAIAEGLAVLAIERGVEGDGVAGFGGVWYGSHTQFLGCEELGY
jgi:hypothetical protein